MGDPARVPATFTRRRLLGAAGAAAGVAGCLATTKEAVHLSVEIRTYRVDRAVV